uniref:Uncharacterized protein n=1 Tax=Caenorhabditis japonica TaxID=281687 RepID=A0A8R1EBS0_CAEJA
MPTSTVRSGGRGGFPNVQCPTSTVDAEMCSSPAPATWPEASLRHEGTRYHKEGGPWHVSGVVLEGVEEGVKLIGVGYRCDCSPLR